MGTHSNHDGPDVFAEINSHTIAELWVMLGLPGEPKSFGNMKSPHREERTASFSIHGGGYAWKDHGGEQGAGGDGVEFVRVSLRTDHAGVRDWWLERSGIDYYDHGNGKASSRPAKPLEAPARVIHWPGEVTEGKEETWGAFAGKRGITPVAARCAVELGLVRFVRIDGKPCYIVTDSARRNAEIRRFDGSKFGDSKAFPLKMYPGAKSWPVGCALLEGAPKESGVFLCEGATDFISGFGLYSRYRKAGGRVSWKPLGLLGASCKQLAPDAADLIRGRRARIVFDADNAGEAGAAHWRGLLLGLGCTVDTIELPAGCDLTDVAADIEPETLFSL